MAEAVAEADRVGEAEEDEVGPRAALWQWVRGLCGVQRWLNAAAAAAAEAGSEAAIEAALASAQAQLLAGFDGAIGPEAAPADPLGARRHAAEQCALAGEAALRGALRAGDTRLVSWLAAGGRVQARDGGAPWHSGDDVSAECALSSALLQGSNQALLGARVCSGRAPRPPAARRAERFAPLRALAAGWPRGGRGLGAALAMLCASGHEGEFMDAIGPPECLEDGELMRWLAEEGRPAAWAGRVGPAARSWLLSTAGSADALRLAVEWLAVAEWDAAD
jgi:hypothetical protein